MEISAICFMIGFKCNYLLQPLNWHTSVTVGSWPVADLCIIILTHRFNVCKWHEAVIHTWIQLTWKQTQKIKTYQTAALFHLNDKVSVNVYPQLLQHCLVQIQDGKVPTADAPDVQNHSNACVPQMTSAANLAHRLEC